MTDNGQPTEQVNVRFSKRDLAAIDAEVERRKKDEAGTTVTRSDVIRTLVLRGLRPALVKAGGR